MVMERTAGETGALGEAVVFLDYFKDLPDPRQRGKVLYPLDEVLLLCLLAVLAGSEAITDIARFGEKKLELLRRFRPFRDGTPSHDHLGDILATLDAKQFQRCFVAWVAALTGMPSDVIAIDGKTSRRSKKGAQEAIHMVSAFAARHRDENLGQEGRLRSRTQRQPRHSSRGRRAFHDRAEGQWLQGYEGQPTRNGRRRPWAHRDQNLYG